MILLVILIPVFGAGLISFLRSVSTRVNYDVFICTTGVAFAINVGVLLDFYRNFGGGHGILRSSLGGNLFSVDNVALLMLLLSTFLFFVCALCASCSTACFYKKETAGNNFFTLLLLLEAMVAGVFATHSAVIFYVFFEASLIPMFLIIGFWGYEDRISAAFMFLIYTVTVSLLFLLALVYGSIFSVPIFSALYDFVVVQEGLASGVKVAMWTACFLAFGVKLPIVPFHTWLPKAHVQAPTLGSMLLAGLLIKMGGYGFIRFCIGGFSDVSLQLSRFVFCLSAVSLIYSSLVAYAQKNMKTLIAYSSVAHMSYVVAGIFALNENGIMGAIFQMVSHGLISAALFLCVGMIYTRTGTLEMSKCGGLASSMPRLSSMVIFFSMASAGLPGTSGFIGEFLSILGIFQTFKFGVIFFATGMVLGAAYMLRLCKEVIWGVRVEGSHYKSEEDINTREFSILVLLAGLVVILGVFPSPLINFLKPWISDVLPVLQESLSSRWG